MAIELAYVLPHPPLAIPDVGGDRRDKIPLTLAAFDEVAREIAQYAPETIVFVTPHNVMYADYFHISPGEGASGDFSRYGAPETEMSVDYDPDMARAIAAIAESESIPAGSYGETRDSLDHGVMVPLWFINHQYRDFQAVRVSPSGMEPTAHYRLGLCISWAASQTGRKTVLVASGDLSHRHSVGGTSDLDPEGVIFDDRVLAALESGDFLSLFSISDDLRQRSGQCGYNSIMALAGCFNRRAVASELLSYEHPYGVGYAIARFQSLGKDASRDFLAQYEQSVISTARSIADKEDTYCQLARRSLEYMVNHDRPLELPDDTAQEMLESKAGVFVSLHKGNQLRGCIGTLTPTTENIACEIMQNAVSAGFNDDRFKPVRVSELPYLTYKVDVLTHPEFVSSYDDLDANKYGVVVSGSGRRGLLLPKLPGIDTPEQQIAIARRKAGLAKDDPIRIERFEVTGHI